MATKMDQRKEWISNTNVYEVNLRQYSPEGTFAAFQRSLPRLKDMGVRTLWFMPVTPISEKNRKGTMGSYYACSSYTGINPEFGSLADFQALVREAHNLGMKVIIDWVANHTGWDHHWTVEHPEWYKRDEATSDFKKASGMDDIIELDFSNGEMRKEMIAAMRYWVDECSIDGFRCDLAFWVQLDFWLEARQALDPVKPLFWLAEADGLTHPEYLQAFDAAYTWTWMATAERYCKEQMGLWQLKELLNAYQWTPGIKLWFTTNHDENSWNGTEYEKYGDRAKCLAVFSCLWPGIPLVYSGQELPNFRRLAFFEKDPISWNGEPALHQFYKTLLSLKNSHPALGAEVPVDLIPNSEASNVLSFVRQAEARRVLVLINLSGQDLSVSLQAPALSGQFKDAFTGGSVTIDRETKCALSAFGFLVLYGE
jgi:alpha-amylase